MIVIFITYCILFRNDYKHLVEYLAFYMNVKSEKLKNFQFYQPGANHDARFMCDSHYFTLLEMSSTIIDFLGETQRALVSKVTFLLAVYCAPSFLKASKPEHAVLNDFQAYQDAEVLRSEWNQDVGEALKKSFDNHTWYLSPKCVILALADPDLERETKIAMLQQLLAFPVPELEDISLEAPAPVVVSSDSKLEDYVTEESWLFFIHTKSTRSVEEWFLAKDNFEDSESYKEFFNLVCSLSVTNDCAERNIGLIQDFIDSSHNEDQRQNVLLVVREHRKLVSKNMPQSELSSLKPRPI